MRHSLPSSSSLHEARLLFEVLKTLDYVSASDAIHPVDVDSEIFHNI
jgi:hypothetical protein